ncbi:MAG: hypothetical protein M3N51_00710 [Actinomycetota bacterium]|nr:hypothetical protein [Actinomycetota bacterium]
MPVDPVEAVPAAPAAAPPAPPVEETLTASAAPVPAAVKSAAPNGGLQAFTFGAVSPSPFRRPAAPVLWWEEMMASMWEGTAAQWYGLPLEWQAAIAGGGIIVSLLALSRLLRSLSRVVPALLRRRSGSV